MLYRIAKWSEVYERAESRKLKTLTWVSMPIGFHSNGYQLLLDEFGEDAASIYGAWCALVAVAASCAVRGVLGNSRGHPLKISHIARITGFRNAVFEDLFRWAAREDVGWLVAVPSEEMSLILGENDISGEAPDDPPTSRGNPPSTGPNPTEPDKTLPDQTRPRLAAANARAREAAADGVIDFDSLDRARTLAVCSKLASAIQTRGIRGIASDWIWAHVALGELIKPGMIEDVAAKVLERQIRKPRAYVERALREECEAIGVSLGSALARVPERECVSGKGPSKG